MAQPPVSTVLPDAPARTTLTRACTACHGVELMTSHRDDKNGWGQIVDAMVAKGATLTPEEADQIIDYLAGALPKQ